MNFSEISLETLFKKKVSYLVQMVMIIPELVGIDGQQLKKCPILSPQLKVVHHPLHRTVDGLVRSRSGQVMQGPDLRGAIFNPQSAFGCSRLNGSSAQDQNPGFLSSFRANQPSASAIRTVSATLKPFVTPKGNLFEFNSQDYKRRRCR